MDSILKNSDNIITETITNSDGTNVEWANVTSFKVILKGNFSTIEPSVDTDTDGQFTYYIPKSFTQENSYVVVYIEFYFTNAKFSDGKENVKE